MRRSNFAGLRTPLLAGAGFLALAGCATKVVDPPPDVSPQVTAVYAVDFAGGVLADVLLYSAKPSDKSPKLRISKMPPTYSALRVEFNLPLAGESIANANNRGGNTFCTPLGTPAVAVVDSSDPSPFPLASSVCFDPTSPLGSAPHAIIVFGEGAAFTPGGNPFTCQQFAPPDFADDPAGSGNVLKASHEYTLQFTPGAVKSQSGKAIVAPDTATAAEGWTGLNFKFTTSGMDIMVIGYSDQNTGFLTLLAKPFAGYLKDLDPVANYRQPADDTPIFIITTEQVNGCPGHDPSSPDCDEIPLNTANAPAVTLTRHGGDSVDGFVYIDSFEGGLNGDGRTILAQPGGAVAGALNGGTFEGGQQYDLTIDPTLTAVDGSTITAANGKTYTITAADAALGALSVSPTNASSAVSIASTVTVRMSAPVDATTVTTDSFKVSGPGGAVAGTVAPLAGTNSQRIRFTPTAALLPETTYTVTLTGLKVKAGVPTTGGQTIPTFTSTFTTATFRTSGIFNGATNIDRAGGVSPVVLKNGALNVQFTNVPAGTIDNTNVKLAQVANNVGVDVPVTITAGGTPKTFIMKVTDPAWTLKFNKFYRATAAVSITDSVSGKALKREGCTSGDCSDVRTFTTAIFAPGTIARTLDAATGNTKFTQTFNFPVQIDTVNNQLTNFKLFTVDASGALTQVSNGVTCTGPDGAANLTKVVCVTNAPLNANSKYLVSMTYLSTTPALVAPTITSGGVTYNTDQTSGKFFGTTSLAFTTACPP